MLVRQKSKDLSALLTDESKLQDARKTRATLRNRLDFNNSNREFGDCNDDDLQRAIEESRRTAALDERRRNNMDDG